MIGSQLLNRFVAVAALTLTAVSAASATESGVYVGGSFGQAEFQNSFTTNSGALTVVSTVVDDRKGSTWSGAVGYRFNPAFALELSYVDLGELTHTETGTVVGVGAAQIVADVSAKGPVLVAIATIPLKEWEINFRLGAFRDKTEFTVRAIAGATSAVVFNQSGTEMEAMGGIGVGYTFADHFHVRVDLTAYPAVGKDGVTGDRDVTTWTTGFQYRF